MSKLTKIQQLKKEYPIITKQVNEEIIEIDLDEYEATLDAWADAIIVMESKQAELDNKISARTELLQRLGITADEAKLLLA
jgi:ribosome assembly protein YihI (activator of Der GTPase)